jgi:hypothetical protein
MPVWVAVCGNTAEGRVILVGDETHALYEGRRFQWLRWSLPTFNENDPA